MKAMTECATDSIPWATAMGHAIQVLVATPRRTFRLASVHHFLMPPVRLHQIVFSFNSHGFATGYACWAYLTDVVAAEVAAEPGRPLALAEWNEGTSLWLMDVVAPFGTTSELLRRVRQQVGNHDAVFSLRNDRPGARMRSSRLQRVSSM